MGSHIKDILIYFIGYILIVLLVVKIGFWLDLPIMVIMGIAVIVSSLYREFFARIIE